MIDAQGNRLVKNALWRRVDRRRLLLSSGAAGLVLV
jgi:hypothetical protein